MKILTKRKQQTAELLIVQTMRKIMSHDAVKATEAIEELTLLAFMIGGMDCMNRIGEEAFGGEKETGWTSSTN